MTILIPSNQRLLWLTKASQAGLKLRFIGLIAGCWSVVNGGLWGWQTAAQATIAIATETARAEQKQQQLSQVRPENYDVTRYPVTDANAKHWKTILWTTAVQQPQADYVATAFDSLLQLATRSSLSKGQQRTVEMSLQVGTQLYLSRSPLYRPLQQRFQTILTQSSDPEWVAMALSAVTQGNPDREAVRQWSDRVRQRFPNWPDNIHLFTTLKEIEQRLSVASAPPLADLLNWQIAPRQPHLYVICQSDRSQLCLSVLKDQNGQFLREPVAAFPGESSGTSQLWSVPLLLTSLHGLNWNFSRGQTPQGIYRMEGVVPQPDLDFFRAYGQFALVKLFAPREPGVKEFLPGRKGTIPNFQSYQTLLPPTWRNYFPVQQSYWAGKSGRGLFRIHGSGEAPNFFGGKPSQPATYNWNPTIGCLSALELYNESGQLVQSDMPKILQTLTQLGGRNFTGYVVVTEIPASSSGPITVARIEAALRGQSPAPNPTLEPPSQPLPRQRPNALPQPTPPNLENETIETPIPPPPMDQILFERRPRTL
jgi:hypothetical protein